MMGFDFRKGQRLAGKACQSLMHGVVPALLMCPVPAVLAELSMRFCREHRCIGEREVAVGTTAPIASGNGVPRTLTRCFTVIPDYRGDNLVRPSGTANGNSCEAA